MCLAHGEWSWSEDLNEIIDMVNFGGKKIVYLMKIGGFRNGTQQDLNKMVDMVKFWGQKDRPDAEKNRGAYLLTLKEGVPPGIFGSHYEDV